MEAVLPAPDFGIPEVKPAIESISGLWVRKMNPKRRHAILQYRLCHILTEALGDLGEVGSEWRWAILPRGEKPSSLVPDVTFVSFERLPLDLGEIREAAAIAPDIAIEILSPGDNRKFLRRKIDIYLSNGSHAVIVVDPAGRRIIVYQSTGAQLFDGGEIATIDRYPQLRIDLTKLFDRI
ncbi:MAG TPA: Uma2 family endonuclease [Candidatus Baltobacteraceae bacterium]|nr:Uma2 family endonuclease [Candidatus Baltobacteraceae bacterium]